jgi:acetyl esterase/lipase
VTSPSPCLSKLAAYISIVCALLPAAPSTAAGVETISGVVYGSAQVNAPEADASQLLLDLYRPASRSRARRPIVVIIHGGGFTHLSRADPGVVRVAGSLAALGVVVASIDYRVAGQEPVPSERVAPLVAALPAGPLSSAVAVAVDDALTAIDYLRAHAKELRIDMHRLGLVGSSAGAITADHVAYVLDDYHIERPKIRFVASLWGGILVPSPEGPGTDPADQLEHGEAPLFAVHGDADTTVPVALSDALVARARAQKVRNEYYRIRGGVHGYDGSEFFTRAVVGNQTPFDRLLRFAKSALRRR